MLSARHILVCSAFGTAALCTIASASAQPTRQKQVITPKPFTAKDLPAPRHPILPGGYPKPYVSEGSNVGSAIPMPADYPVASTAKWTYLVYIAGDNDLEDYVVTDIETELALPGSSDDVQVVAMADRTPGYSTAGGNWTGTLLFHVQPGQTATPDAAIADLGERNMGNSSSLEEFVSWSKEHFPAERYALIFWDHGWTWRPGQSTIDETDGDALDLDEVTSALTATGPVDVVGFDECFMASLEIQAALRPHASAMVGSEDYVGWEGFKHDQVLTALTENPDMDAREMAVVLSASMTDRTISAVALDESWDGMMIALDQWSNALRNALPGQRKAIEAAWKTTQGFGDPLQKDLYDATLKVEANVKDPAVQAASQALRAALKDVTLHEWHRSPYFGAYGSTLYWPLHKQDMWVTYTPGLNDFQYYLQELDFSHMSSWDNFLDVWAQ